MSSKWEEEEGFSVQDILDWAKENASSFYQRLRYTLIETSPLLF